MVCMTEQYLNNYVVHAQQEADKRVLASSVRSARRSEHRASGDARRARRSANAARASADQLGVVAALDLGRL